MAIGEDGAGSTCGDNDAARRCCLAAGGVTKAEVDDLPNMPTNQQRASVALKMVVLMSKTDTKTTARTRRGAEERRTHTLA